MSHVPKCASKRDRALDARTVDMKLEVVVIPVSDVDRAKRFYGGLGWRLDADFAVGDAFRVVQFTPPGSPGSIHFGKGSRRPRPVRRADFISSCPTSRQRAPTHRSRRRRGRSVPPCRSGQAAAQRPGSGAAQLLLVRHVQRSGRQRLALAGGHRAISRTGGRGRDDIRLRRRISRARSAVRRPRTASTRSGPAAARCELAGLVRRIHGRGAGRQAAAVMSNG